MPFMTAYLHGKGEHLLRHSYFPEKNTEHSSHKSVISLNPELELLSYNLSFHQVLMSVEQSEVAGMMFNRDLT